MKFSCERIFSIRSLFISAFKKLGESKLCLSLKKEIRARQEIAFIRRRARNFKIDIPGRLEWIEDAWIMIRQAKKSRDETFSRS